MRKKVQTMGEQIVKDYLAWKERELLSPGDVQRIARERNIQLNRTTLWRLEKGKDVQMSTLRLVRDLLHAVQAA